MADLPPDSCWNWLQCYKARPAPTSISGTMPVSSTIEPSGRVYLGKMKVTTNAAGTATIASNRLVPPVGASFITATATDPGNNTSALSNSVW